MKHETLVALVCLLPVCALSSEKPRPVAADTPAVAASSKHVDAAASPSTAVRIGTVFPTSSGVVHSMPVLGKVKFTEGFDVVHPSSTPRRLQAAGDQIPAGSPRALLPEVIKKK